MFSDVYLFIVTLQSIIYAVIAFAHHVNKMTLIFWGNNYTAVTISIETATN